MSDVSTDKTVNFYWRPGCPFCMKLEFSLRRNGIEFVKHNIWENPEAAAVVRAAADGNETVPTVVVGNTALVNPSVKQVKRLL